jgi:hypothetical protein
MIDGQEVWLCDRCPTPQEIAARREQLQESWSPGVRAARLSQAEEEVEVLFVRCVRQNRRSNRGII